GGKVSINSTSYKGSGFGGKALVKLLKEFPLIPLPIKEAVFCMQTQVRGSFGLRKRSRKVGVIHELPLLLFYFA
ncbi:hypothetical protein, partial [Cuspidothrix issatschenkoi]|uniref:hypothetical protein n=1 Tax=Cuspidothrix issatschenkoi TaxID=230752 RepID=UPI003F67F52E